MYKDEDGNEILIKTGFFGPYVTDGAVNASMGKRIVADLTIDEALKMLTHAKTKPKKSKKAKTQVKKKTTAKKTTRKKSTTKKTKTAKKTTSRKKANPKS